LIKKVPLDLNSRFPGWHVFTTELDSRHPRLSGDVGLKFSKILRNLNFSKKSNRTTTTRLSLHMKYTGFAHFTHLNANRLHTQLNKLRLPLSQSTFSHLQLRTQTYTTESERRRRQRSRSIVSAWTIKYIKQQQQHQPK
jgi:hypothetical protein